MQSEDERAAADIAELQDIKATLEAEAIKLAGYFKELDGESPRAAVILAVAGLEDELGELIKAKFPADLPMTLYKELFGPGLTPFGNFKTRNAVARAFGYYGAQTQKKLETISEIRNRFAHAGHAIDFHDPKILPKCVSLGLGDAAPGGVWPSLHDYRQRFIHLVQEMTQRLLQIGAYIPDLDRHPPAALP